MEENLIQLTPDPQENVDEQALGKDVEMKTKEQLISDGIVPEPEEKVCPGCKAKIEAQEDVVFEKSLSAMRLPGAKRKYKQVFAECAHCGYSFGFTGLLPSGGKQYTQSQYEEQKKKAARRRAKVARKKNRR